jgi:hypothetical protein
LASAVCIDWSEILSQGEMKVPRINIERYKPKAIARYLFSFKILLILYKFKHSLLKPVIFLQQTKTTLNTYLFREKRTFKYNFKEL